ncbi:hypothetical protein PFISCL1PPCAC_19174, partial [Pristionchus fissidentatus]
DNYILDTHWIEFRQKMLSRAISLISLDVLIDESITKYLLLNLVLNIRERFTARVLIPWNSSQRRMERQLSTTNSTPNSHTRFFSSMDSS